LTNEKGIDLGRKKDRSMNNFRIDGGRGEKARGRRGLVFKKCGACVHLGKLREEGMGGSKRGKKRTSRTYGVNLANKSGGKIN